MPADEVCLEQWLPMGITWGRGAPETSDARPTWAARGRSSRGVTGLHGLRITAGDSQRPLRRRRVVQKVQK